MDDNRRRAGGNDKKKAGIQSFARRLRAACVRRLLLAMAHGDEVRKQKYGLRADTEHDAELLRYINNKKYKLPYHAFIVTPPESTSFNFVKSFVR